MIQKPFMTYEKSIMRASKSSLLTEERFLALVL